MANRRQKMDKKWWLYKIDDKTKDGIKSRDKYYIRKFYEDNAKLICNIAAHFWWSYGYRAIKNRRQYSVEDMVNQIYVDLPLYEYEDSRSLYKCMITSCRYVDVGGIGCVKGYHYMNQDLKTMSLDKVLVPDGKDFTLYKMLAAPDTCEKEVIDKVTLGEYLKMEQLIDKLAVKLFPNDTYMQDKFIRSI